jgi:SAM-dependent methyltransferase
MKPSNIFQRRVTECLACGRMRTHVLQSFVLSGRLPHFAIWRCLRCGLGRTDPRPSDPYAAEAALGDVPLSDEEARSSSNKITFTSPWAEEIARALIVERVPKEVLDIGCGEGDLVAILQGQGFVASGIELRPRAVRSARQSRKLPVEVGSIDSFLGNPRFVGTIVLSHVLEHLPDPVEAIRALGQHTAALVVAVPNSLSARALVEWANSPGAFAYAPHEHVWQMTPTAVARLYQRAGLRLTYLRCHPLRPRRRSLIETARAVIHTKGSFSSSGTSREGDAAGSSRDRGFLRKACWQIFDRTLLLIENSVPIPWLADQVIAIGSRHDGPVHT